VRHCSLGTAVIDPNFKVMRYGANHWREPVARASNKFFPCAELPTPRAAWAARRKGDGGSEQSATGSRQWLVGRRPITRYT